MSTSATTVPKNDRKYKQVYKVIWQEAASPPFYPLRRRMDSSDIHPQLTRDCLDPYKSPPPERHLDRFSRFCTAQHVPNTQTNTQTTLRATSAAIGRGKCAVDVA